MLRLASNMETSGVRSSVKAAESSRKKCWKVTSLTKAVQRWTVLPISRRSTKYSRLECLQDNWRKPRMYGSIRWRHRNVPVATIASQCGEVRIDVMKHHSRLQACSSWQDQSGNLKVYGEIGLLERGKAVSFLIWKQEDESYKPLNHCWKAEVEPIMLFAKKRKAQEWPQVS